MTTYTVLRAIGSTETDPSLNWAWVAHVEARSAPEAVRETVRNVVAGDGEAGGTYVAVPARSWKPVTVEAVQTTVLRLS